jgi:lipopolysaccharide/colanic/teichoic acid biosynthesis glycosyltransferase
MARAANVPLLINATTVRALDEKARDPYTVTKREGEAALSALEGLESVNLRLPAVYGEHFTGRLAFLNRLPGVLRRPVLALASAFRPVVSADRVADAVSGLLEEKAEGEVLVCDPQEENPVYRVFARGMDLAFAAVILLLFWWVLGLVWLAVRSTSQGPGIFAQPRVGKDEEIFICYKFRTMQQEAPQAGTHEVPASHITQIGRFLRKTKIDELPQIWNLAVGEMSLVGPRPCLPGQTELIEWRRKLGVFRCRPGITGLSQVEGVDMSVPERLARLDARYCALRTVVMDARLVFVTLLP